MRASVLALLALCLAPHAAHAVRSQVLVVDASGPLGAYLDLQQAIDAAQDGDLLLVKSGTYSSFTLSAKGLSIVADVGAEPLVLGRAVVSGLGADQHALIRGVDVRTPLFGQGSELTANAGTVQWIDAEIRNGNLGQGQPPEALKVTDCAQVVLVDCQLFGSQAGFPGAGTALLASDSDVQAYGTLFAGAEGAIGQLGHGGHGARIRGGSLFASGCQFTPGDGGDGVTISGPGFTLCKDAGDGGSGVLLEPSTVDPAPTFTALDCQLAAGAPGQASLPSCADGIPGLEVTLVAGTEQLLPGIARSIAAGSPVRFGEDAHLQLAGEAGDVALLAVALGPSQLMLPGQADPFLLDPVTTLIAPLLTLPESGEASLALPVAAIASVQGLDLWLQGLFLSSGLELFLGAPTAVSLLDPAF